MNKILLITQSIIFILLLGSGIGLFFYHKHLNNKFKHVESELTLYKHNYKVLQDSYNHLTREFEIAKVSLDKFNKDISTIKKESDTYKDKISDISKESDITQIQIKLDSTLKEISEKWNDVSKKIN